MGIGSILMAEAVNSPGNVLTPRFRAGIYEVVAGDWAT
jgi:hypothetical protein